MDIAFISFHILEVCWDGETGPLGLKFNLEIQPELLYCLMHYGASFMETQMLGPKLGWWGIRINWLIASWWWEWKCRVWRKEESHLLFQWCFVRVTIPSRRARHFSLCTCIFNLTFVVVVPNGERFPRPLKRVCLTWRILQVHLGLVE